MAVLDDLSGFEFEDVMEDVFRNLGYENVRQADRTADEGRDVIMEEVVDGTRRAMNVILLVLSSSVMYQLEHQAQPELFSSIPATLWWGAMTLTTVGYGDMFPVTELGQLAASFIAVFGIGLFALPASILAAGFIEDSQSSDERTRSDVDGSCPHCGESLER